MIALPKEILQILESHQAPERLKRHLELVHDVACMLVDKITLQWPGLQFDHVAVLFGAATHDIGKLKCTSEIYEKGDEHEELGYLLLKELGYTENLARFARNHGNWDNPDRDLEELLVSVSDVIWSGIRINKLEEMLVKRIAERLKTDFWEIYPGLDAMLSDLATGADKRSMYQRG